MSVEDATAEVTPESLSSQQHSGGTLSASRQQLEPPQPLEEELLIIELQGELAKLVDHNLFGVEAGQILEGLELLKHQAAVIDSAGLRDYFSQTIGASRALLKSVDLHLQQLASDVEQAYLMRDAALFSSSIGAYEKLGRNLDAIDSWRELEGAASNTFPLLKSAEYYRVQNQLENELSALRELADLGFQRENIPARITELTARARSESIANRVKSAHQYFRGRNYDKATAILNSVLRDDPANTAAKKLRSDIVAVAADWQFKQEVASANQAAQADRWSDAKSAYSRALAIRSNDKMAMDALQVASAIVNLDGEINGLLSDASGLGDKAVAAYATGLIDRSDELVTLSPKLTQSVKQLRKAIEERNTPATIEVASDGEARIEVRGVGWIEPTKLKRISLNPGSYKLYAHCRGHAVALNELVVPVNQQLLRVSIGCGSKI